jgi:uncharacterized protein YoxC
MRVDEGFDRLAGKEAGDLIRAEEWNALVAAVRSVREDLGALADSADERFGEVSGKVEGLDTRVDALEGRTDGLDTRVDSLDTRVDGLDTRVDDLETGLQAVKDAVADLRGQFRRVTMRTGRATYAVGELAEITARVTDLDGKALALEDAAARPWVDFVTVWGQLRAAPGFDTVGGAGDRTLCVRVNAQGEARVRLRAEAPADLSEEVEFQMATFMTTKTGAEAKPLAQAMLEANTPSDTGVKEAYRLVTAEYDRDAAVAVRDYVDGYYLYAGGAAVAWKPPAVAQSWRDYRSTVVALVKGDNDPVTAEPSLGACSLQVTFRDWIAPWIVGEYLPGFEVHVPKYGDQLSAKVGLDYREAVEGLKAEVSDIVRDKGALGRQRDYRAIDAALDRLNRPDPPPFLSALAQQVQGAVRVQRAVEQGGRSPTGEAAFFAMTDATARADASAAATKQELTGLVQQKLGELEVQVKTHVEQAQQTFRDDLLAESGPIKAVERQVGAMSGTVAALRSLDVQAVASGITVIKGMDNRLKSLELTR